MAEYDKVPKENGFRPKHSGVHLSIYLLRLVQTAIDLWTRFWAVFAISIFVELMKFIYSYYRVWNWEALLIWQYPLETILFVVAFDCLDTVIESRQHRGWIPSEEASLYKRFCILPVIKLVSKCRRIVSFLASEMQLAGNSIRQMGRLVKDGAHGVLEIGAKLVDLLRKSLGVVGYILWPLKWLGDKIFGVVAPRRSRRAMPIVVPASHEPNEGNREAPNSTSVVQYNLYLLKQDADDRSRDSAMHELQLMDRLRLAIENGEQPQLLRQGIIRD